LCLRETERARERARVCVREREKEREENYVQKEHTTTHDPVCVCV